MEPYRGIRLSCIGGIFRFPLTMNLTEEQILERRIWRHFSKGLTEYRLLDNGDRILIGLSGGKDSLALLEFMAKRARIYRPHIELEALHVRMANINYESDTTYLEQFAAGLRRTADRTRDIIRPHDGQTEKPLLPLLMEPPQDAFHRGPGTALQQDCPRTPSG